MKRTKRINKLNQERTFDLTSNLKNEVSGLNFSMFFNNPAFKIDGYDFHKSEVFCFNNIVEADKYFKINGSKFVGSKMFKIKLDRKSRKLLNRKQSILIRMMPQLVKIEKKV